jgi:hypothetical protein
MHRQARSKLSARLAAAVAFVLFFLAWFVVRGDVKLWESAGWTAGPEMGFVIFLPVAGALATFYLARRVLDGPSLSRTSYSLGFPGPVDARVSQLSQILEKRGYRLDLFELDDAAEPIRPAAPDRSLGGLQLGLVAPARQLGRARVVLRLSEGQPGVGLVESEDTPAGFYDELAQYVLAALAELVPGITYKGAGSALDAEAAESLRTLLPERPSQLEK